MTRLFVASLRIEIQPNEITPARNVGITYHSSTPSAAPQSASP